MCLTRHKYSISSPKAAVAATALNFQSKQPLSRHPHENSLYRTSKSGRAITQDSLNSLITIKVKRFVLMSNFNVPFSIVNSGANKGARRGSRAHRGRGEEHETGTWLPARTSSGVQSKPASALRPSDPLSRTPHQPQRYCIVHDRSMVSAVCTPRDYRGYIELE